MYEYSQDKEVNADDYFIKVRIKERASSSCRLFSGHDKNFCNLSKLPFETFPLNILIDQ